MKSFILVFIFLITYIKVSADEFELVESSLGLIYGVELDVLENNIVVAGRINDTNNIFLSNDKGETWKNIYKFKRVLYYPFLSGIHDIKFIDENTILISFDSGIIEVTTNQGKTWKEIIPDSTYREAGNYKVLTYNKKAYLFQYHHALVSDGNFDKWVKFKSPFDYGDSTAYRGLMLTKDGYFKSKIYKAKEKIEFCISVNIKNFETEEFNRKKFVDDFYFFNKDIGWSFYRPPLNYDSTYPKNWNQQIIYKTIDGGKNWNKQYDTSLQAITLGNLDFYNQNTGFAYGLGDVILFTKDGGENWQFITPSFRKSFLGYISKLLTIDENISIFFADTKLYLLKRKPTSVEENDAEIALYPNPATDYITINPGNEGLKHFAETDEQVEIYNSFGELVLADVQHLGDVGHLIKIDVSHLPVGLYFVRIGNRIEKFVKM